MKSFIFCTSYIGNDEKNKERSVFRLKKWIQYYENNKTQMESINLVVIDDGSSISDLKKIRKDIEIIDADQGLPESLPSEIVIFHFTNNLGRVSLKVFPGWWRSFTFSSQIAKKYSFDKIIHIESDAFILSNRMLKYVGSLKEGWTAFWSPRWKSPEAALQVICGDSVKELERLYDEGEESWRGYSYAEKILPFTLVEKNFIGDRYGEHRNSYPYNADYMCQARLTMKKSFIPDSFTIKNPKINYYFDKLNYYFTNFSEIPLLLKRKINNFIDRSNNK